jgi:3-(3-hydroxy-phenyl)propionate hydroxylase
MTEPLKMDEPRRRIAGTLSGPDIHCNLEEGHPPPGRRMPDFDLHTPTVPSACSTC